MHTIQRLSSLTINQIAAGEVIENPASVVKELVENSVDAKSSHIHIEILAGGFQLIKITDDGIGMSREDALLSIERHTTSKMILPEDLLSLSTMGFRGEALASIASISKLTLLTSQGLSDAVCIEVEGGEVVSATPAARVRGTSISVRSLFYNVPARKKFQKSAATSGAEITKIVTQLALAHPSLGFTLIQQGKTLFCTEPGAGQDLLCLIQHRAEELLSSEFVPSCKQLRFEEGPYSGWGLISEPTYSRHNRSGQHLFVNNRPVFCPAISYAMKEAYGTRISPDKHPLYVLHLAIEPSLIDVNVHPQKREIRLKDEGSVRGVIHNAVQASFSIPPLPHSRFAESFPSLSTPFSSLSLPSLLKEEPLPLPQQILLPLQRILDPIGIWGHHLLISSEQLPPGLLKSSDKGIVFVHLQRAEQRIAFEKLLKEDSSASQGLLLPLVFSFSSAEMALMRTQLPLMAHSGIHMHEIGKETFAVTAIPPQLEPEQVKELLDDLLEAIPDKAHAPHEAQRRAIATLVSRKLTSASYTLDTALWIFKQLLMTTDPLHTPQGKATLFHLKEASFESH